MRTQMYVLIHVCYGRNKVAQLTDNLWCQHIVCRRPLARAGVVHLEVKTGQGDGFGDLRSRRYHLFPGIELTVRLLVNAFKRRSSCDNSLYECCKVLHVPLDELLDLETTGAARNRTAQGVISIVVI